MRVCRRVDNGEVNAAPPPSSSIPPSPGQAHDANADRREPRSLIELFLAFNAMALQGFGGVLAVVQREMVERRRWMTRDDFVEEWAVAQVMPGPNVINLGIIFGSRHFGWRGAVFAVAGLLVAPTCLVLSLALLYAQFAHIPQVQAALRGMSAVSAGLIAATGLKLLPALGRHILGWRLALALCLLSFVAVAVLRLPLAWVLLAVGGTSCVLTWRRLAAAEHDKQASQ